jgi:hypothetical protein
MKTESNIYITGDFKLQMYKFLLISNIRNFENSNIIINGNFGIGILEEFTENKNLNIINNDLIKNNNNLFLVRGNRENKKRFESLIKKYSNIHFCKSLKKVTINKINFLPISKSLCYDRIYLIDYIQDDISKTYHYELFNMSNIDVVLSNDNVNFIYPYNIHNLKGFRHIDKTLYRDISKNRNDLSSIYKELKNVKYWFSSKYDINKNEFKRNTNFIQLKNFEFYLLKIK